MRLTNEARRGQLEVIGAALLFAASVPVNKLFLGNATPLAFSAALYLSAGLFSYLLLYASRQAASIGGQNSLHGREWVWLTAAVCAGGVLAPLLLLLGLRQLSGHVAGLLLNFEMVFTLALGAILSGERLGRRGWIGAAAIVLGSTLLAAPGSHEGGSKVSGAVLVIGACALWGLDNNLTQRVALRDSRQIVAIKGLAGGGTSLVLAALFGGFGEWTSRSIAAAALTGAISFGLSIALFVRGLRRLGVLQAGALFALAPGFAALLSWILLREPIRLPGLGSLVLMTLGSMLLTTDHHEHLHEHAALDHVHEHEHDAHHQHDHEAGTPIDARHTHQHRHSRHSHSHAHVHDAHHRHR